MNGFPMPSTMVPLSKVRHQVGGKMVSMLMALARLQTGANLVTVLGHDEQADKIEQRVFDKFVGTAYIIPPRIRPTDSHHG